MAVSISSSIRINLVSGDSSVTINAPVVPSFTTDDIFDANNPSNSLTSVLAGKQTKIGAGNVSSTDLDLNVLAGAATAGILLSDLVKLHAVTAAASDINQITGATSNVQTQLNALSTNSAVGPGVNLTGLTISASQLNSFFSVPITTTALEINKLHGFTGTVNDLNVLASVGGHVTPNDFVKLGAITASATELSSLVGFTGTSIDLNKLHGMTASQADLNAIAGLAGASVTTTQST